MARFARLLVFLLAANVATAGDFHFHELTVAIPPGFEGPIESRPNALAESAGFAVPGTVGIPTNALQMSRIQLPETVPVLSEQEQIQLLSMHLSKMLKALEGRRTSYSQTPIEKTKLGGSLAVRASWTGKAQDLQMNGVLYCLTVGSGVFFVQASGPGEVPDQHQAPALAALKALRLGD